MAWIVSMNDLFNKIFGDDFFSYEWDRGLKRMVISPECFPAYQYNHTSWEEMFPATIPGGSPASISATSSTSLASSPTMGSTTSPASSPTNYCSPTYISSHTIEATSTTGLVSIPTMSSTSQPTSCPTNINCSPSFDPGLSVPLFFNDLRVCAANNSTRGQLATLNLPPVIQIADDNIQLVVNPVHLDNPLQLPVRPSESAITKGYRVVNEASGEDSDDEDLDTAVKFGDLGVFDSRALDIWMKASRAAFIKVRVQEEVNWLNGTISTLTPQQINAIRSLLFDSEPQEEILKIGDVIVDTNDLSTLAAERYLNGFVIDAACMKYSEEAMSRNSHSLYLPSFTQTWASSSNLLFLKSKLKPYLSGRVLNNIIWILTPIHVNGNHWGLLCLNMVQRQAFYDDGLKQNPPRNMVDIVDNLLKAVSCNSTTKWSIPTPFERFGMPKQPLFGEGCASCGVGVVLAVFDFIENPDVTIPKFHWHFHDMGSHRQRLLYRFTQWK